MKFAITKVKWRESLESAYSILKIHILLQITFRRRYQLYRRPARSEYLCDISTKVMRFGWIRCHQMPIYQWPRIKSTERNPCESLNASLGICRRSGTAHCHRFRSPNSAKQTNIDKVCPSQRCESSIGFTSYLDFIRHTDFCWNTGDSSWSSGNRLAVEEYI